MLWINRGVTHPRFLRHPHSRFGTSSAVVVGLVKRVTGRDVESLNRVVNGYDNEVYRVDVIGWRPVYVRIHRQGEGDLEGETWAMEQARGAGVPVPEVLALDRIMSDDGERHVMVAAAATGRALETVEGQLSTAQRHDVLLELGRVLGRLHAVQMPGFWRPDSAGRWPSLRELRSGFIGDRLSEREELVRAGLSPLEIDQTYGALDDFPGPAPIEPVLCHGDIDRDHVFIDSDSHVTGLIDWGMWHAGSYVGELAYVWKLFGDDGLDAVLVGHRGGTSADPDFRRWLAVSLCQQQIGHIAHHVRIGDEDGVERNVLYLRRALAEVGQTSR